MDKKLISEITRIGEMMGIKNSSLITEAIVICPFCDLIMRRISDLSALATKNSDSIEFKYKVNELLEKVKNEGNLTIGQKNALQTAINKLKEVESASDNVASFKSKVDAAIKQNDALSDVLPAKANLIDNNIMRQMDYSKIYQDPKLVDDFFKNSPLIGATAVEIDKMVRDPGFKTTLSKFKSVDDYVGIMEATLKDQFEKAGFNATLSAGLANKFKTFTKELIELNPNLNPFISKIDNVVEPISVNSVIKRPRKVGMGSETLEQRYADMYNDIIKKNGDELTNEEKLFKYSVEKWKNGDEVDFEKVLNTKVGEPEVNTGGEDTIESASAEDVRNLFERSADEVNIEDLNVIQKLREFVTYNSKVDDSDMTIIKNVLDAIKKGKKVSIDELSIRNAFKNKKFSTSEIDVYIKKLNNPTKGNGFLDYFYWSQVEPRLKGWTTIELPTLIKRMWTGKGKSTQDLANDFQRGVEKALSNYSDSKDYSAVLNELRIKFGKIRQEDPDVFQYYGELYSDWVNYMETNLTGQMLTHFKNFNQKLLSQKSNWKSSSWSNMIGKEVDDIIGPGASGEIQFKFNANKPVTSSVKQALQIAKQNFINNPKSKVFLGQRIQSYLERMSLRTPRELEEFLIKKGYKRNGRFYQNARLQNAMYGSIIKYLVTPLVLTAIVGGVEELGSALTGTDWVKLDLAGWFETFFGFDTDWGSVISSEFKERAPWFYQFLVDYGILKLLASPAATAAIMLVAKQNMRVELDSPEEQGKQAADVVYNGAVEKANTKAKAVWDEADDKNKEDIYAKSNYKSTELGLSGGKYPNLTTEQHKFLLGRLSFEPTPNLTALRNIKVKPIPKDITDFKNINKEDYIDSDNISKAINSETVGNAVLQGKSGKKYVVIRSYRGEDPFKVLDKTNDNNIEKQGVAVVKPSYGEIKPTTDLSFISLNQFVEEYNDL